MEIKGDDGVCKPFVTLEQDGQIPHFYDVELNMMGHLRSYDSVELHVVLYPYSRMINSSNYNVNPFEEYARDISGHLRSSYVPIHSPMGNIFGIVLGTLIAAIFYKMAPQELYSVEAIVAILGAYAIGKELYGDIDNALVRLTKNWPLRFLGHYYAYRIERGATLTGYSALARNRRYGKMTMMPELFDFMEKSNSMTVRMMFTREDMDRFSEETAHILSIQMDEDLNDEFLKNGFMLGVKLSLNKRWLGFVKSRELYQSIEGKAKGCLASGHEWVEDAVCQRTAYSLGRMKYFSGQAALAGQSILEHSLDTGAGEARGMEEV